MKKLLFFVMTAMLIFAVVGCTCNPTTSNSPTPMVGVSPTLTPSEAPTIQPMPTNTAEGTAGNDMIEGFVEGGDVAYQGLTQLTSAITEKYPDATIRSVAYAMHEGRQVYKVVYDNGDQTNQELYIGSDFTIIDPTGTGNGTDNGTGNNGDTGNGTISPNP